MKRLLILPLLALVLLFTGCPAQSTKPTTPNVIVTRIANYELQKFDADLSAYEAAVNASDWDKAKIIRDASVYRLKRNVDMNYGDFESALFSKRATTNVLFDIAEIAANTGINVSNGARAKNILSAALAGFKGGRGSFDENFFQSQSIQTVISKMQASRARVGSRIGQNLGSLGPQVYSLDEALGDVIEYFYAGTLQHGLQELSQQAGADALQAKSEAAAVAQIRVASDAEFDQSKQIRLRITQLARDLKSADQQTAATARDSIKSALTSGGVTLAANVSDDDLIKALVQRSTAINRSANREADQKSFLRDLKVIQ